MQKFSKLDKKLLSQIEQEKLAKTEELLKSPAEQEEFTQQQLESHIANRIKFIEELSKEEVIPAQNIQVAIASLAPLAFLSIGCLATAYLPEYEQYLSSTYFSSMKYAAINLCFQSGIHWGFAMSMHEQQMDSINSSKEARIHFLLGTIPIIGIMLLIQSTLYDEFDQQTAILSTIGLFIAQIAILGVDLRVKRQGPGWFLRYKLLYSISFNLCLLPTIYVGIQRAHLIKQKPNPYRLF
ncbi:hypothetical protein pb186bvf_018171 [Paramecium bursaria]